jgi:hypothetical protein
MIKISNEKKHEFTKDGLCVFIEGTSMLALTSPEAQKLVYNYVKESGFKDYGMNKFVFEGDNELSKTNIKNNKLYSGYWVLLPRQWNQRSVTV